jgi:3-hydroxyacyl-CoA dehydrogenase
MINENLKIGVAGAGVMGSGIAQVMALSGCQVVCRDIDEKVLDSASTNVDSGRFGVKSAVERGKLSKEEANNALGRIHFTTDLSDLNDSDLIIEAIPERFDFKISFWKELDKTVSENTIFASNSSGFSISAMAAATERADRFIGWHWASPAPVMKLAEIVRGRETSQETVDVVVSLAEYVGKNPVVIADTDTNWGYVTNRVYFAMVREAAAVVKEGIADHEQVDQLMTDCFRWPSGPFGMTRGATSGWN